MHGPKIMSNMVQIPLAPLIKWVHILWSSILRCPTVPTVIGRLGGHNGLMPYCFVISFTYWSLIATL